MADKPSLFNSFLNTAKKKENWYLMQVRSIECQKAQAMNIRLNQYSSSNLERNKIKSQSLHIPAHIRTSAEDIINPIDSNKRTRTGSFSNHKKMNDGIREKTFTQEKFGSEYYTDNSKSQKILRLINNNHSFGSMSFNSKNKVSLDIISNYYNSKKTKQNSIAKEANLNKISIFTEDELKNNYNNSGKNLKKKNLNNVFERVMSATFYGLKNKKQRNMSSTSQKFYQNKSSKSPNFKNDESKLVYEQGFIKNFPLEGKKLPVKINNLFKEKFQMIIKNFKQSDTFLKKTKHRMFFTMQKEKNRAHSASLIRKS